MKKFIALLLAAMMLVSLWACGAEVPEDPETTEGGNGETTEAPVQEDPTEQTTEQTTETPVAASPMELAESCIDKSVEELYELIGEPESADYAPSCLNPGVGEDGNLYYDGFIVYTYREGDTETVSYVEEAE